MQRSPRVRVALAAAFLASALAVIAAVGCGDEVLASEFDQTCAEDDDCVPVLVGEICDCVCSMAAINKGDLPEYQDRTRAKACGTLCSPCAPSAGAYCNAGKCEVR